ncbi:MAG: PEP-CTERM sorting domain-containing protein [Bdellovibrionales bacterium]|nr:PEP-CTERM sorting domain-containing protein [Bdellovibrionales bacterium]
MHRKFLLAVAAITLPLIGFTTESQAAPIYMQPDLSYSVVSGAYDDIVLGQLGRLETTGTKLFYDSLTQELSVTGLFTSNKGVDYALDLTFGAAQVQGAHLQFDVPAPNTSIGTLTALDGFSAYGSDFAAGTAFQVGARANREADSYFYRNVAGEQHFAFRSWLELFGLRPDKPDHTLGFNIHWETVGNDHVSPPGEPIPEPATVGLLAAGLLGGAIRRRKHAA